MHNTHKKKKRKKVSKICNLPIISKSSAVASKVLAMFLSSPPTSAYSYAPRHEYSDSRSHSSLTGEGSSW